MRPPCYGYHYYKCNYHFGIICIEYKVEYCVFQTSPKLIDFVALTSRDIHLHFLPVDWERRHNSHIIIKLI